MSDLMAVFSGEIERLIESRPYSSNVASLAAGHPLVFQAYFAVLLAKAGSSDFTTANAFADAIDVLDNGLAASATDEEAFRIVASVAKAADIGAWSSRQIRGARFASAPKLRIKALGFVEANEPSATATLSSLGIFMGAADFISNHLAEPASSAITIT